MKFPEEKLANDRNQPHRIQSTTHQTINLCK